MTKELIDGVNDKIGIKEQVLSSRRGRRKSELFEYEKEEEEVLVTVVAMACGENIHLWHLLTSSYHYLSVTLPCILSQIYSPFKYNEKRFIQALTMVDMSLLLL